MEYAVVDATIVKVHRHDQGATGGMLQSLCVADCSPAERSLSGHLEEAGNESGLGGGATNRPPGPSPRGRATQRGYAEVVTNADWNEVLVEVGAKHVAYRFQPRPPPPPPP
jgi:hypothetical protein